jgi:hypothetical protein
MVDEMLTYTADLEQPITFPIKASLARRSWDNLKRLLDVSRAHSITIWSGSNPVDPDDLVYIRENSDIERVYYDLPDWMMDRFLDRLNMTGDGVRMEGNTSCGSLRTISVHIVLSILLMIWSISK